MTIFCIKLIYFFGKGKMKNKWNVILNVVALMCFALLAVSCADTKALLQTTSNAQGGELLGSAKNNRPEHLKISEIPDRVRYVSIDDDDMVEAEAILNARLTKKEEAEFVPDLLVFPGLMNTMIERVDTVGLGGKKMKIQGNFRDGQKIFFGSVYQQENAKSYIWEAFLQVIGTDSIKIRTLKSEELSLWWVYIPFDIMEPIFMVNDRYIIGMNKDNEIFVMDDISNYTFSGMVSDAAVQSSVKLESITLLNTDDIIKRNFAVEELGNIVMKIDTIVSSNINRPNINGRLKVIVKIKNNDDPELIFSGDIDALGVNINEIENAIRIKKYRSKTDDITFMLNFQK